MTNTSSSSNAILLFCGVDELLFVSGIMTPDERALAAAFVACRVDRLMLMMLRSLYVNMSTHTVGGETAGSQS